MREDNSNSLEQALQIASRYHVNVRHILYEEHMLSFCFNRKFPTFSRELRSDRACLTSSQETLNDVPYASVPL